MLAVIPGETSNFCQICYLFSKIASNRFGRARRVKAGPGPLIENAPALFGFVEWSLPDLLLFRFDNHLAASYNPRSRLGFLPLPR